MITTRELVSRVMNGGEVQVSYQDRLFFVIQVTIRMGTTRIGLFPIHENANWAGTTSSFDIPASDNDLPMWETPAR